MHLPEQLLIDHLPGYIGWKDLNRRYLGANKALLELKGFRDAKEITGKTDEELSPWANESNKIFQQQDVCVLNGGTVSIVHSDSTGKEIFQLEKSPLTDQNNNITGLIYYCRPCNKHNEYQNKFELTIRECECVYLLIKGKSAKEIAALLSLSKRTIESYIENIKNKMDCKNKAEILVKAILNGYHKSTSNILCK